MADATPMIQLRAVTKHYAGSDVAAVDALDLAVPRAELVVLVGPSGCGKTTTLKMINRIIEPTSGVIEVDGNDAAARPAHELRREIGYVIQRVGLFPHRTVRENISTVPALLGWSKQRIDERVDELLELMGLDAGLATRYPAALSGGQQQRVGVARALAADPPILLMDEPFAAVDPVVREHLQLQLLELQERLHKTIVFVTHDIDEAIRLGDRIAILDIGGRLAQYDTPTAILRHPADDFVAGFLGRDRNLRRLALLNVGEADLTDGPVAQTGASATEASAIAGREGTDWIGVLDGQALLGWCWLSEIPSGGRVGEAVRHDFRVLVSPADTLRSAMDAIVANRNQVAVVAQEGRFLGMLFIEQLSRELLP